MYCAHLLREVPRFLALPGLSVDSPTLRSRLDVALAFNMSSECLLGLGRLNGGFQWDGGGMLLASSTM